MPLNIIIGLVALFAALILYSVAIWGAFRAKFMSRRHVTLVWIGFVFDTLATAMMAIQARGLDLSPLSDLLHTIVAFVAMFGMLAVAILGSRALANGRETTLRALAKWSVAPWAVWLFIFLWGMASRGSQRMG